MPDSLPEVWLRGPLPEIPAPLQPVAHTLLQAGEEVRLLMDGFPNSTLWTRPGGVAAVGFHLQHLRGVLDRLFTYARGETLSPVQIRTLGTEGTPPDPPATVDVLVSAFENQVRLALAELEHVDPATLGESRKVGRDRLPSTVIGLYVHAAEHTMRHVGQLLVTARVQRATDAGKSEA